MKLPRLACIALSLGLGATAGCMKERSDVVFRPTNKEYPREVQVVDGKAHEVVLLKPATVEEAAGIYADFSKKEVRVPRALIEQPLADHGESRVAPDGVTNFMEFVLPLSRIEIVPLNGDAAEFRTCEIPFGRIVAKTPPRANPEQVAAAKAAMDLDRFWQLIETARNGGGSGQEADGFRFAIALQTELSKLRAEEILGFQFHLNERMAESFSWDLWAVAYIVNGGASDDGFGYFCGWLISQGRAYHEAALKDPVRAADRAGRHQQNENEQIFYSAMQAYQAKTGAAMPQVPYSGPSSPIGKPWKEADLPKLYPELTNRF